MIDLSSMSLAEIEAAVAEERARRRNRAIAEINAIAASYGVTVQDLVRPVRPVKPKPRTYGAISPRIVEMLRSGHSIGEVANEVNRDPSYIYVTASQNKIKIKNGRAVL